jgi:hypothetical protein
VLAELRRIAAEVHLHYFFQRSAFASHTVGLLIDGQRIQPQLAFLDSGATIGLMSHEYALSVGLPVFSTTTKLATSTLEGQNVFGITDIITTQFGAGDSAVNLTSVYLVTTGMSRLYVILISNDAATRFNGITDAGNLTFSLSRPDGGMVTLPLCTRP